MRSSRSLAGVPFLLLFLPFLVVLLTTSPSSTAPLSTDISADEADEDAKEGFTLAVVRRDSIAIPFATYDGKRWKNSWPQPESRVTAPIALADVPKRWWSGRDPVAKWTFWPLDASDGASRTLETIGPTWFPAHCQQGLGLRTTYSTREVIPPPHIQPYPKAGVAVAGNATIAPIEIVDIASSPLVDPLARTLVSAVYEQEVEIVRNYMRSGDNWRHPYTEDERKETPFRIEALYKVARGLGDRDVYYFEGLKHYAIRDPKSPEGKSSEDKSRRSSESSQSKGTRTPTESAAPAASPSASSQPSSSSQSQPPNSQQPSSGRTTSQNLQSTPKGQSAAGSQLSQPAEPAAKSGGGPGQEPCDLVTFVSGWLIGRQDELLKDKERITPKQVKVVVTSCDFAAARIMLPLGVVRVKDKAFWAVQWSGWTHEHYSVLDVKDDDLIAAVTAGGGGHCPPR